MKETTRKFKFESGTVSPVRFVNKSPHWRSKKRIQNKRKKKRNTLVRSSASKNSLENHAIFFLKEQKASGTNHWRLALTFWIIHIFTTTIIAQVNIIFLFILPPRQWIEVNACGRLIITHRLFTTNRAAEYLAVLFKWWIVCYCGISKDTMLFCCVL